MKITQIETLLTEQIAIVKVRTDTGAEGIGQTSPFRPGVTVDVLHNMIAPFFLGEDPWDLGVLVDRATRQSYKFKGTFILRALAGIDTAIWDLLGKAAGVPVYKLLGGKVRDRIPVYASSMRRDNSAEDEAREVAEAVKAQGFRCAKLKIGGIMGRDEDALPGRTEGLIKAMREEVGDDVELIMDGNGGFSAHRAIQVGRLMEKYGYYFFEEPCPFPEYETTAKVTAALDMPVAGGEQDNDPRVFWRMMRDHVVDIVQPDVLYLGGVTRIKLVAEMANMIGVPCTPHCSNFSMIQIFTMHLAAAMPACYQYQEYGFRGGSWLEDVYEPLPEVVDGYLIVPDDIEGWGVSITPGYEKRAERRVSTLE